MSMISPFTISLSAAQEQELSRRARRVRTEVRDARRARIILAAARETSNAGIARAEGVHVDTVRKWRSRFAEHELDGLRDLPRSGRPPVFEVAVVAEVKALACQLPAETGTPLSRWSHAELAAEATVRGIVDTVSASTVRRWLHADAIKPWQHRSWIFPRDPEFAVKAGRVLGLYQRVWNGRPLGEDEYVISADEKSQLQFPNAKLVHLPVHASWLNQVEIYFSIVQRKVVKPQDFADLGVLEDRLLAFQDRYNTTAIPFNWRFGRTALHDLLHRIKKHENTTK